MPGLPVPLRGTLANRPAANSVPDGTRYVDENDLEYEAIGADGARSWAISHAHAQTTLAFNDLSDVDLESATPTDLQTIVYDDATDTWVPGSVSTVSESNDLSDVGFIDHGSVGTATEDINAKAGTVHKVTLIGNPTFTFSGAVASEDNGFTLLLVQDATGSRTATWPASIKWPGGAEPTLTGTAASEDIFTFFSLDGGTSWYGFSAGMDMQ